MTRQGLRLISLILIISLSQIMSFPIIMNKTSNNCCTKSINGIKISRNEIGEYSQESIGLQKQKITNERLNEDMVYSISTDSSANLFVTGSFYQAETNLDVFVSKFLSDGSWVWSKYLIGEDRDIGTDIAIDSQGNIIIVGVTFSDNFTTTEGAIKEKNPSPFGESDLFVTKFHPTGIIIWSTFLGGSARETGIASLAIDSQDDIIVVGFTNSEDINITGNSCYPKYSGGESDTFISKIHANGSLIWSTYFGGSSADYPIDSLLEVAPTLTNEVDVAINSNDDIIISCVTESDDFPILNAEYENNNGGGDIFLSTFNSTGSLLWSTFFGGDYKENAHGVAINNRDQIIITGSTFSPNFPIKNHYDQTHNGNYDAFLSTFNSTGSLLWSTFLGGGGDDRGYSIDADRQNNVYITGRTESDDFPVQSAYDDTYNEGLIFGDAFLTKFTDYGDLVWSTYFGGENDDVGVKVTLINHQNPIISGHTDSENLKPYNTPFLYSFRGPKDGFVSKFQSTGRILSFTRALVVTEPNTDPDHDELKNIDEFCHLTDPFDPDTDDDMIGDGIEVETGLCPLKADAYADYDGDGLFNLFELAPLVGPKAYDPDTDNDGMPDGWELVHRLKPTYNDSFEDADNDSLPNIWEYQNNMSASDHTDAVLDPDHDTLTNLNEYLTGTDPHNPDTDGDNLPDGWEVQNRLNPLNSIDANQDSDADGFSNKLEYQLGFDPQSPIELYAVIFLILFLVCLVMGFILWTRNLNKKAILLGFKNNADKKAALKAGFQTVQERSDAKNSGFLTAESYNLVRVAGWFNVQEMVSAWQRTLSAIKGTFTDDVISDNIQLIGESISPVHLNKIESQLESFFAKIGENKKNLIQITSLQQTLITHFQTSKKPPLVGLAFEDLNNHYTQTNSLLQFLIECEDKINVQITQKKEIFAPWPRLLTLVQLTEDRSPVKLSEIAKIIDSSEERAEYLITLLLRENELIGKYDAENKVYIKGHDLSVLIQTYIKEVKEVIEDFEK